MNPQCTIQLHTAGQWQDVANVTLLGSTQDGWRASSYSAYDTAWALEHTPARDAHALAAGWPVGLEPVQLPHWPGWLIDMLPQGLGRQELLARAGLPRTTGERVDWALLQVGAGNPIGHLRVKEAAEWLAAHAGPCQGFTDDEVAQRGEGFAEHLAAHGLFVGGSSGVQGEWPKILLTRAEDGLLYLDHTLPDERARQHYIVKFGRGADAQLARILHHEAPYMALARRLGLRVLADLTLRERALFIPRFDRRIVNGQVERLAQESIATFTGLPGFESLPSHEDVCAALLRHATDPQTEVLEYLRRDVANLALGNKDNHARNTAVQRDAAGHIALTPLYDFAPMYLHPDGIARRIRWAVGDAGAPDWARVLDRLCELDAQRQPSGRRKRAPGRRLNRVALVDGLRAMTPALQEVAEWGETWGLAPEVLRYVRPGILDQAQRLASLV